MIEHQLFQCRFCLKILNEDEKQIFVNSWLKNQFVIIAEVEFCDTDLHNHLKFQNICEMCYNITIYYHKFQLFRSQLIENQKRIQKIFNVVVEENEVVNEIKSPLKTLTEDDLIIEEHIDEEFLELKIEVDPSINSSSKTKLCQECGKVFSSGAIKRHYERVHLKLKRFFCDFCDYNTYSRNHIEIHLKSHLKIKSFFCEKCGKAFGSGNILRQHRLKHQSMRPYECDCGKDFKSSYALKRHQRTHLDNNKTFECEICNKMFADNWHLKRHQSRHKIEIHSCETCGKSYGNLERLKAHEIYHRDPNYICQVLECNKKFHKRTDFTAHMKTHTKQKDFKCNFCPNSYYKNAHLNRHLKLHQNENEKIKIC